MLAKKQNLVPLERWFEAPSDRTMEFYTVLSQASRGFYNALRSIIAPYYLKDIEVFSDTEAAYPMLVYWASRPNSRKGRADFGYDVLNSTDMNRFYRLAARNLRKLLPQVRERLVAAGHKDWAEHYAPRETTDIMRRIRTQSRYWRTVNNMILAEQAMFNEFLRLRAFGEAPAKIQQRNTVLFHKKWDSFLHRFYGRYDFSPVGDAILLLANKALMEARDEVPEATSDAA